MWGAIAASIGKGLPKRTWGHHDKGRRPRPIGGPGKPRRRPGRKLTTSQAAIRRSEERRGIRTTGPKPPTSRGPRRSSRTINTGPSRGRRLSSRTSRTAIARFKAMRGRRRR